MHYRASTASARSGPQQQRQIAVGTTGNFNRKCQIAVGTTGPQPHYQNASARSQWAVWDPNTQPQHATTNAQPEPFTHKHYHTTTARNHEHNHKHNLKHTTTNTQPQHTITAHNHNTQTQPQKHNHKYTTTTTSPLASGHRVALLNANWRPWRHPDANSQTLNNHSEARGPTSKVENKAHGRGSMRLTMA